VSVRENAIPGVRCGKCLGRIDKAADDMKRKIHAKLRPNEPYVGPYLCSDCWLGTVLTFAASED
jgi:ribosomal protein L34E